MAIKLNPPAGSGSGGGGSTPTDLASIITLTFTGEPQTPMYFTERLKPAIVPAAGAVGSNEYTSASGKGFEAFSYTEDGTTGGNFLETIDFEDIKYLFGQTEISSCGGLDEVSFSTLVYLFPSVVGDSASIEVSSCPVLDTLSFPVLDFNGQATVTLQSLPLLTSFSLPSAVANGLLATIPTIEASTTGLTSLVLGSLKYGSVQVTSSPLTTLTLTALIAGGVSLDSTSMVTVSLPAFTGVGTDSSLFFSSNASLTTITAASFSHGSLSCSGNVLTAISLPALATTPTSTGVVISNEPNLVSISLPALTSALGSSSDNSFYLNNLPSLTSLTLTNLATTGLANSSTFHIKDCDAITSISVPALTTSTDIEITGATALTTFSVPALINLAPLNVSPNNALNIPDSPSLANATIGAVGVTLSVGGHVRITGAALTQAKVDAILHVLSTLDGTGGTSLFNYTVDLSGGTSASPSVTGLVYAATLTGNGATVVTN